VATAGTPGAVGERVVVLATTRHPHRVDAALRRPGRLECEIDVRVPNARERAVILRTLCATLPLADDVLLDDLSTQCVGFVGADLNALSRSAALCALQRNSVQITLHDFDMALLSVVPTMRRS
jgi:transitional endoplasmic reticulum ATPase